MAKVAFVRLKRTKSKKKPEWKEYSTAKDSKKRLTLGVFALVALVVLILLGRLAGFIGSALKPLDKQVLTTTLSTNQQVNLVLKADHLSLLSFDPVDKTITVLKIPDEVSLSLPFDFGSYPARSVFDLGQSEKNQIGAKLLSLGLSQNMGVPIDGYLITNPDHSLEELVDSLRKDLLTAFKLDNSTISNLSRFQVLKLGLGIRGVRVDKVKFIDLERSELTKWQILPDKSRVLIFDNLQLDRFLQNNIVDSQITEESLNVAVFNATDHPGLAIEAARQLSNIGIRVIMTDSWEEKLDTSLVAGKTSYTKSRIQGLFSDPTSCPPGCAKIAEISNPALTDVNLILGEDFYNKFHLKP